MSLNALVNQSVIRNRTASPNGAGGGVVLAPLEEENLGGQPAPPPPPGGPQQPGKEDTFNKLVKFIPTESITLFVGAMAAAPGLSENNVNTKQLYWGFCFATPVILLLILLGKRRAAGLRVFPPVKEFPFWELIASFVAFAAWAVAVPGGPYLQGGSKGVVAGFLALLVSSILSLVEPLVARRPVP
jgi:hypothetical protein